MVFCRDCGKAMAPGGCYCGFLDRRRPARPDPVALPTACWVTGFAAGLLIGIFLGVFVPNIWK